MDQLTILLAIATGISMTLNVYQLFTVTRDDGYNRGMIRQLEHELGGAIDLNKRILDTLEAKLPTTLRKAKK